MKGFSIRNLSILLTVSSLSCLPISSYATDSKNLSAPMVSPKVFDAAKKNTNWKFAYATGEHAQVVFMSVSPQTNPKNEIGMETHSFDQIIFIVSGKGQAVLKGKPEVVNIGDMIFIPKGTPHNVINMNPAEPLKILSVYSDTDIPANAVYKTVADQKE